MDFNLNKDFADKQPNQNKDIYMNYHEPRNSDFAPYQTINKPKIPMSYYFPEGNQRQNIPTRNNLPHNEDEEEQINQYYMEQDLIYNKNNFTQPNEELLANAVKMSRVNMNNINNMNINIFNPMPVNPAKNLMMNQTGLDNQDLLENFAKMNVKNDSDVFNNNSNKRAIAYNYYFGGGENNLEFEREKEDIYRIENWDSLNHHSNNFSNSNHHYMPSNPYGPSIQNLNSNFQKYNTYNNNNPTPINNHNHKVAGYKIQSNKISNPIGKYGEINNRVKSYGNKYYDSNGADMKGNDAYQNNKYDSVPLHISNTNMNIPILHTARYFVLKSVDEENIHKSIKYRIWCSTIKGNQKLQKAFKDADNKYPIYLFFSVNGSGRFLGLAQMTSEVEYRANFNYWSQNEKWKGFFFVVWLIIKDIPNRIFTNIINEYNENKPVTSSRDTQEIHPFAGAEMLRIFKQYQYDSSILDDFNFFEKRQEKLSTRPNNLQINLSNMNNIDDGAVSRDVYNKFSHDQGNFSNYVENFNTNLNQSSYSSIPNDKSKYEMYGRVDSQLKYEKIENNNTNDNKFLEFQPNMYRDNRNNFENTPGMSGTLDKSFNLPSYNNLVDRSLTINEEQNKIKRVIKRINSTDNILKSTVAKNKEEND